MRKGLGVVAMVVAYALAGWLFSGKPWAPPRLVAPEAVLALADPLRPVPPPAEPMVEAPTSPPLVLPSPEASREGAARRGSWPGFLDALRALEMGRRQSVRVVHLGDSEIVADGPTRAIRKALAARFGDGGPGFGLIAPPVRWYVLDRWSHYPPSGMTAYTHPHGKLLGGEYGPGGVAFEANAGAHATVDLDHPEEVACTIRLSFSRKPEGGVIRVLGDGTPLIEIRTEGRGLGIAEGKREVCPRRLELTTHEGSTRIHGYEVRYARRGITWSTLGVIGAELTHLDHYAEGALEEGLAALEPDLIVLGFGLNRAGWPYPPEPGYADAIARILRRVRQGAPEAACLVIGPYPSGKQQEDGTIARVGEAVSRHQAAAAQRVGCAFIDRFALAGGPTAAVRWASGRPRILSGDYQHMTALGAERMGSAIARLILAQYEGASFERAPLSLEEP